MERKRKKVDKKDKYNMTLAALTIVTAAIIFVVILINIVINLKPASANDSSKKIEYNIQPNLESKFE
jgi:hypothetical protein